MHSDEQEEVDHRSFKDKKFNDNNLTLVREGIADGCGAYGLAAVFEFRKSSLFPTDSELQTCKEETKHHTQVLLSAFKKWLDIASDSNHAFKHRALAFRFYGPLLSFYDDAIKHGDGYAREVIYQLQLPIYAQLNFPNYYTECFRHTVNFLAKRPLVTRTLLQNNCAINVNGKANSGIELDGYVEAELVRPLKNYASGHSTVMMCEKIMANLDLFRHIRVAYKSKQAFEVHSTSKHSVANFFPDQLKVAWFCVRKGFFKQHKHYTSIDCFPVDGKGKAFGVVPTNLINAYEKGKKKINENFKEKLYDAFSDLRFSILNSNGMGTHLNL